MKWMKKKAWLDIKAIIPGANSNPTGCRIHAFFVDWEKLGECENYFKGWRMRYGYDHAIVSDQALLIRLVIAKEHDK